MKGLTSMISRVSECNAVVGARDINGILPHRPAGVVVCGMPTIMSYERMYILSSIERVFACGMSTDLQMWE